MGNIDEQAELFGLIWRPLQHPFRLRVNDVILFEGRFCRVIRVTESAAVMIMQRRTRIFTTRFDNPVRFQPPPRTFRISANSEIEILNRRMDKPKKRKLR